MYDIAIPVSANFLSKNNAFITRSFLPRGCFCSCGWLQIASFQFGMNESGHDDWIDSASDSITNENESSNLSGENALKLSNEAYFACMKLSDLFYTALNILKTPVAKVCPGETTKAFAVKQRKLAQHLNEIREQMKIIRTNKNKLQRIFPNNVEDAQMYLLGRSDDISCLRPSSLESNDSNLSASESETENNETTRAQKNNTDDLELLRNDLREKEETLYKLQLELMSIVNL